MILVPLCLLGCSSVIVGEGACVKDYRGVGQKGVIYRVGTVDQSASGVCGGGRGSGVNGRGK
jgi:hypothetical protein